jgi:hypothetical protein
MKITKIALVFFPINDAGGVITWNKHIQTGFKRLGIETMYFYATPGNVYGCNPDHDIKKERYTMLAGWHLSYSGKNIKQTIAILNSFDAVIFTKSSPHPTKDNLSKPDIKNWVLLYTEVKVPKVVVFHDELWEKTNEWSKQVAPFVDICIGAQKRFMESVQAYPGGKIKYWDYFPMDLYSISALNLHAKQNFGMVATQWIKWKNHHKLLPMLPQIKVPIYLFGAGMEWHYLKKTPEYLAGIGEDWKMSGKDWTEPNWGVNKDGEPRLKFEKLIGLIKHNPDSPHKMIGSVVYEELQKAYARALFSIDLSTRGYTNYTHFEPLAYRTFSFIERRVLQDSDCMIPDDCCLCYDMDRLPEMLNELTSQLDSKYMTTNKRTLENTLRNGQNFVQRMDCLQVAKRLVDNINKL